MKKEKVQMFLFRPKDSLKKSTADKLEECFETMELIDKTVCEDIVIYVFKEKLTI